MTEDQSWRSRQKLWKFWNEKKTKFICPAAKIFLNYRIFGAVNYYSTTTVRENKIEIWQKIIFIKKNKIFVFLFFFKTCVQIKKKDYNTKNKNQNVVKNKNRQQGIEISKK